MLDGRYRLDEILDNGGMATVWRAADLVLERAVAVKVPRGSTGGLRREAKAAAALTHPHITAVYDYGEAVVADVGRVPYVVMELLRGETLAARLARGALPWREAAAVGARLADALAAAHAAGVVHRDVKPANVFLTPGGVKVLDFGIAFTRRGPESGPVWGTPAYVAPEAVEGAEPAPSADVYSLGVVLREALTDPDAPGELLALCDRCTDRRPEARPDAARVAEALGRAAGVPVGVAAVHQPSAPGPAGAAPPRNLTRILLEDPAREPARRRAWLVAGALVAGAALLAALPLWRTADPPRRPAAVPATPTASATSTAPSPPPGECLVEYRVTNRWPDGFQAEVAVVNLGDAPVDGWRLSWEFGRGEQITQLWEGAHRQRGRAVTVDAPGYDPRIPPGDAARFGFLGRGEAADRPEAFTLNGSACRAG